jgi:hypothetical protein
LNSSKLATPISGQRRGRIFVQEQPARLRGGIERRSVDEPHVVDGRRPGLARQRHRLGVVQSIDLGIHGADEVAVGVVIVHRPLVRAGHDQQRPVLHVAIVEIDAGGEHVVVGVRIERPVLVPFHRSAETRGLHVELGAMQADVVAEVRQDGGDRGCASTRRRRGNACGVLMRHAAVVRKSVVFKIVDLGMRCNLAGIGDVPSTIRRTSASIGASASGTTR